MALNMACSNGQGALKEKGHVTVMEQADEPYSIDFSIEELNDSVFNLRALIKIDSLSYMTSIVNKTMSGIFKVRFMDSLVLNSNYNLIEKACPVVTNFVWSNAPQKVIIGKVEYIQKLTVNARNKFIAKGEIQFVIEPRCTLEKVPFTLFYNNGNIKIKKD